MPSEIKKKPVKKPTKKPKPAKKPATKSKFGASSSKKSSKKKKNKAPRKMSKSKSSSSSECVVCMDKKAVKTLNPYGCPHKGKMCQSCTTEVARTSNKCPTCRRQNPSLPDATPLLSLPFASPLLTTHHNLSQIPYETLQDWVGSGMDEFADLDELLSDYSIIHNPQYRGNRNIINFLQAIDDRRRLVDQSMSIAEEEIRLRWMAQLRRNRA